MLAERTRSSIAKSETRHWPQLRHCAGGSALLGAVRVPRRRQPRPRMAGMATRFAVLRPLPLRGRLLPLRLRRRRILRRRSRGVRTVPRHPPLQLSDPELQAAPSLPLSGDVRPMPRLHLRDQLILGRHNLPQPRDHRASGSQLLSRRPGRRSGHPRRSPSRHAGDQAPAPACRTPHQPSSAQPVNGHM